MNLSLSDKFIYTCGSTTTPDGKVPMRMEGAFNHVDTRKLVISNLLLA